VRPHKKLVTRIAVAALAAALPLTATACAKGGATSSSNSAGGGTLTLWTHNAGNTAELASIQQIVDDYNGSQTKNKVELQAFPQDSYNQSVVAAAAAKKLPCILDIDGPNVPNWAWGGYLAPLTGMDDMLSKFLPSTVGKYNDKTYSAGYFDVSLAMFARKSVLEKNGIRIPTIDQPWTANEFAAALKTIKDSGEFQYPLDLSTGGTGEFWPYGYSPMLQSFGGDLINRTDFKSADGALNGPEALAWAKWFRSLVTDGYMPSKSGTDSNADFQNGKSALLWWGQWGADAATAKLGDDVIFLPPVDFGQGPKVGGGSWQWAVSQTCDSPDGAMDYMKFALQDKYIADFGTATGNIPATDAAAALVKGYEAGGAKDVFRQFSKKFTEVRPETPGYPFIATSFEKAATDIMNGADPQQALDQAVSDIDANQQSNNYFQ
jgi:multiple sugar transport system substrate-binding protein